MVDLDEEFGDLDVRQHAGGQIDQRLRVVGHGRVGLNDFQSVRYHGIGEFIGGSEPVHGLELGDQQFDTILEVAIDVGVDLDW